MKDPVFSAELNMYYAKVAHGAIDAGVKAEVLKLADEVVRDIISRYEVKTMFSKKMESFSGQEKIVVTIELEQKKGGVVGVNQ